MPTMQLSEAQVVDLVKQLTPKQQRGALLTLAEGAGRGRAERTRLADERLRQRAAERGRDWAAMSEAEREAFVDDLVHEDRPCGT